jgi:PAP2 superfamily
MKLTVKIVVSAVIVLCALRFGASADFYEIAIISAYFAITLIGATIIHLRVTPSLRDVGLVALGTLVFAFIDFRVHHFQPTFFGWISFAGISSLATMGIESVWTEGGQRKTHLLAFVPSLLFVTSEYFADNMLRWAATVHDKVYDLYLYAFDASLHVQIPFAVGRYFAQHSALRQVSLLAYIGLSVPIAVVYAGQVRRTGAKALQCFFTFVITGPMGILFYNAVPALGPAHLFNKNFPWHPLAIDQVRRLFLEPIALDGPRNAIPSLHMAWVLLAWWYSRGLSKMERAVALFYLVFVALATLGTGEHYFVDLVVAVPFALFMESLFAYDLPLSDLIGCAESVSAYSRHAPGSPRFVSRLMHFGLRPFFPGLFAPRRQRLPCISNRIFAILVNRRPQSYPDFETKSRNSIKSPLAAPSCLRRPFPCPFLPKSPSSKIAVTIE